jgi:Fungal specific transcription factor domain
MGLELSQSLTRNAKAALTVRASLRFIDIFFANFYVHFPFIHRPSFNPLTVSLPLLFAVLIIGAAMSREKESENMACHMFDILEYYCFQRSIFTTAAHTDPMTQDLWVSIEQLEQMQACYCVMILQEWEGSNEAKKRMRNVRAEALSKVRIRPLISVTFVRVNIHSTQTAINIGWTNAKNPYFSPHSDQIFNWAGFVLAEMRVR